MTPPTSPHATPDWAEKVLEHRRKLGLTQRELADAAGLTQQAVSYIERGGGVPRFTTMVRLARALGTTVESLFPLERAPLADGEPARQVPPACLS
ncbi:MAG TPA: helix-turn-helix transcriptional regulator [Acidimicrobiales bacterium]|nr:helix-turn-helix transcriptional regulator [Acidimicrobiales bacterium]